MESAFQDLTEVSPTTPWGRCYFSAGETEAWRRGAINLRSSNKQGADWFGGLQGCATVHVFIYEFLNFYLTFFIFYICLFFCLNAFYLFIFIGV